MYIYIYIYIDPLKDSDVFHHDEGRKRQDDFSVDVRNLVDALRSRGNPFLQAGVDLVNQTQPGWKNQQRNGCIGDL